MILTILFVAALFYFNYIGEEKFKLYQIKRCFNKNKAEAKDNPSYAFSSIVKALNAFDYGIVEKIPEEQLFFYGDERCIIFGGNQYKCRNVRIKNYLQSFKDELTVEDKKEMSKYSSKETEHLFLR